MPSTTFHFQLAPWTKGAVLAFIFLYGVAVGFLLESYRRDPYFYIDRPVRLLKDVACFSADRLCETSATAFRDAPVILRRGFCGNHVSQTADGVHVVFSAMVPRYIADDHTDKPPWF